MHLVSVDGEDQVGAIIYWRRRLGARVGVIPPFTQYSALIMRQEPTASAVHRRDTPLDLLLHELGRTYRSIQLLCTVSDPRPFQWHKWQVSPRFTYCVDPSAGTDAWSATKRRTFRKHDADYRIEESPSAANDIIRLCELSYQRRNRSLPARKKHLSTLVNDLSAHVRCFVAAHQHTSTPEAGMVILHDGRTAHYWIAGSMPGPSMTVLLGHVLPTLSKDGIQVFDFVGANTPSIAEFKRQFGPTMHQYYHLSLR